MGSEIRRNNFVSPDASANRWLIIVYSPTLKYRVIPNVVKGY